MDIVVSFHSSPRFFFKKSKKKPGNRRKFSSSVDVDGFFSVSLRLQKEEDWRIGLCSFLSFLFPETLERAIVKKGCVCSLYHKIQSFPLKSYFVAFRIKYSTVSGFESSDLHAKLPSAFSISILALEVSWATVKCHEMSQSRICEIVRSIHIPIWHSVHPVIDVFRAT